MAEADPKSAEADAPADEAPNKRVISFAALASQDGADDEQQASAPPPEAPGDASATGNDDSNAAATLEAMPVSAWQSDDGGLDFSYSADDHPSDDGLEMFAESPTAQRPPPRVYSPYEEEALPPLPLDDQAEPAESAAPEPSGRPWHSALPSELDAEALDADGLMASGVSELTDVRRPTSNHDIGDAPRGYEEHSPQRATRPLPGPPSTSRPQVAAPATLDAALEELDMDDLEEIDELEEMPTISPATAPPAPPTREYPPTNAAPAQGSPAGYPPPGQAAPAGYPPPPQSLPPPAYHNSPPPYSTADGRSLPSQPVPGTSPTGYPIAPTSAYPPPDRAAPSPSATPAYPIAPADAHPGADSADEDEPKKKGFFGRIFKKT
ncbi:MAG: hypothetical protein Tsb0020_34470 [Haliangiales bacterium]